VKEIKNKRNGDLLVKQLGWIYECEWSRQWRQYRSLIQNSLLCNYSIKLSETMKT